MTKSVGIIGSGIAGIASAIRLKSQGFHVEVYESSVTPGGKISEIHNQGYRFDTGPSLFTLPNLLEDLFKSCNKNMEDYISIKKLELLCRYFFHDGTIINAYPKIQDFANEIENKSSEKKDIILNFLQKSENLYELTSETFLFSAFHKLKNFNTPAAKNIAKNWKKLDVFKSMHKKNTEWFSDKKIIQLFDRYATYNGSNPYKAPATLNIIPHLEHNIGAFLPNKGMYEIIEGMIKLAKEIGVIFHFNQKVNKVIADSKTIIGLETGNEFKAFDYVICNADIYSFYSKLFPKKKKIKTLLKQELSSSALIFYWGIQKTFPELDLHNIFFAENYKKEFEHLFIKKKTYNDPTIYIYISSKINKKDAPKNCENWFVMINAPNNVGQNWDEYKNNTRKNIIAKINQTLKTSIQDHILFEKSLDPKGIESKTGSYHGALYGPSSNSKLSAFYRHPNFSRKLKNIFFVGGSVHPGGGIPLCLSSAKIATNEIYESL